MYLTGLISIPRFRAAIEHQDPWFPPVRAGAPAAPPVSLVTMLNGALRFAHAVSSGCTPAPRDARNRGWSPGNRRQSGWAPPRRFALAGSNRRCGCSSDCSSRTPRWTDFEDDERPGDPTRQSSGKTSRSAGRRDERRPLATGQHAMGELRLDTWPREEERRVRHRRARSHREKIQALAEMAVNRQDPTSSAAPVDSAAESMRQTEKAVSELQHLTGLGDHSKSPPHPGIRPARGAA